MQYQNEATLAAGNPNADDRPTTRGKGDFVSWSHSFIDTTAG